MRLRNCERLTIDSAICHEIAHQIENNKIECERATWNCHCTRCSNNLILSHCCSPFYCSLKCHGIKLLSKCVGRIAARDGARSHNLMEKYYFDLHICGWTIQHFSEFEGGSGLRRQSFQAKTTRTKTVNSHFAAILTESRASQKRQIIKINFICAYTFRFFDSVSRSGRRKYR